MTDRRVLPFGAWPSPIGVADAVAGSRGLNEPRFDGDDLYWLESRPTEGGRTVLVRAGAAGAVQDAVPRGLNVRTKVHEYGGGAYVVAGGTTYFSNFGDDRLYRQAAGQAAPITPANDLRYGDLVVDPARGRLICIVEDHGGLDGGPAVPGNGGRSPEPANSLAAVDLESGRVTTLASGYDFYSSPRLSPDGHRLAWLAWRHPNMPWDGCELWVADLDTDGRPSTSRRVAGGSDESIVQPEWALDGSLVFVSDRSGWWNLYRLTEGAGQAAPLAPMEAEFAGPQWVFGLRWYGIQADGAIVAACHRNGRDELWLVRDDHEARRLDLPFTEIRDVVVSGGRVAFIGGQPTAPAGLVVLDLANDRWRVVRRASEIALDPGYISQAQPISFPTTGGATAHALFYPPANAGAEAPAGELPPLIVMSHGGPTSRGSSSLSLEKQLFTSRGFAVVDVDYGGSNGYGRAYMRRLDGAWGIVDVDDCINAARYLAARGLVDENRMAIRGGSAGGYTTLSALVFHDAFAAGASHYGVGDLEALARDTHKFESRYIERLVAPYPERLDVYHERSPIHHMERISRPVIVLQGLEDRVVPPAQAEQLVAALEAQRIPYAYLPFPGEGHGFRVAANIRRALEAELSFYAQVFGFELADEFEPVEVAFLNSR